MNSQDSSTRQEFIRAAVSFLQNPKLVDSPLKDKLKFLKDKGLNEIEVDEALNLALINRHQSQGGKWNFLLILGICIGGYKLYQAYIESKKEKKPVQREETIVQHEDEFPTLNEILQRMAELKRLIELQRNNLASDIQSLKTLLLGHEKFAAPPVIPAWQLESNEDKEDTSR